MKKAFKLTLGDTDDTVMVGIPKATITLNGGGGNDSLTILEAVKATVHGNRGNDMLQDQSGKATLYGDAGDDWLMGTGHDTLIGGTGADRLLVNRDWNHGDRPVDVALAGFKPMEGDVLDLSYLGDWVREGESYVFVPVTPDNMLFFGDDLWIAHATGGYDIVENVGAIALVGIPDAITHGWLVLDTFAKG